MSSVELSAVGFLQYDSGTYKVFGLISSNSLLTWVKFKLVSMGQNNACDKGKFISQYSMTQRVSFTYTFIVKGWKGIKTSGQKKSGSRMSQFLAISFLKGYN